MKNLKKMIATLGLAVVMMMTVSTANAGIILADAKGDTNQPCTEQKGDKADWGIVIHAFTGIVIHAFTGIIIVGAADTPVDCGIVIHA